MKHPESWRSFNLRCECGCSSIDFEFVEDALILSHNIPSFYALQKPGWYKFKEAVRIIWAVLRGKEYRFYEILLSEKEEVEDFKKFISEIDTSKIG